MKKYLMMGAAALAISSAFVGCSKDKDLYDPTMNAQKFLENYQQAFIEVFGQPAANQTWGFGQPASARVTRGADANQPTNPSFSDSWGAQVDGVYTNRPAMPEFPDELPDGITYAGTVGQNSWQDGMTVYLDKNSTWADQNKQNLVIYVNDDLTYTGGISNNGNGYTFIVLKDKTLTLTSVGQNMKVYLAPGATLDLTGFYGFGQFDNSKAGIYMKAGSTLKADGKNLDFFQGWKVLNAGGYITANQIWLQKGSVLWNEGTITLTGGLYTQNENSKIYNADNCKITATSLLLLNNNELIYNDGTLNISGAIGGDNSKGEIINNDTLTAASVLFKAGGLMHNVGYANISGKTHIANTNTKWKNEGQYITGDFEVSDYAEQVYNNCKLTVHKADNTGEFKIYGKFVLEGGDPNDATESGASVVTDKLKWVNNSFIFLGTKSQLLVNGQFLSENKDVNGALVGPTTGYAVVKAASIDRPADLLKKQFGMTYMNNLYVDTDSHFAQGAEDPANNSPAQPYYKYDSTVQFKHLGDASPVVIPETSCNPGYNNGQKVLPSLHVLCEDLTAQDANDFDFNDVVFDVFYVDANTVTIKVLAAGGTLPLRLCGRNDWEVHTLYNVDVKCMVNTGKKYHVATSPYTQQEGLGVKELTYTGFNGWSDDQNTFASQVNEKIKIEVQREENGEWVELTAPVGGPTAKIATPVNIYMKDADWYPNEYRWAWEKQNIGKSFTNWVSNPGSVWYTTK